MHPILSHPRNKDISYYPLSHTYWYQMEKKFDGITGWIKSYCQPFDKDNIAFAVAKRDGKTKQEVLAEWDETRDLAAAYGNYVHDTIEAWVNNEKLNKDQKRYVAAVKKLLKKEGLTVVASEFVVYDEDIERASPIDLLCVNKSGNLVVVDMKTFEKGVQWEGYKDQRMLYPLYSVPDSNYYHTSIQTGWYIRTLNEKYGVEVEPVGYILYLRDTQDGLVSDLIPTDPGAIEMVKSLYKHESNFI
jgi:hypothetical protein